MALSRIANEYRIPIGFENAAGGNLLDRPISVKVKDGTIRDVMDALVRQAPDYEWKLADGVINVAPKRGRDSFLEGLLKVHISSGVRSAVRKERKHCIGRRLRLTAWWSCSTTLLS